VALKVLELFSGTQSISKAFRERDHATFTIELDPHFQGITSWTEDILEVTADDILNKFGRPDVIWASPPCNAFSVASIGHHWGGGSRVYEPKTDLAKVSKQLVQHTIKLIEELNPKYWYIENPRGVLRKMDFMQELPRHTVTYCQYGDNRMKPTDIWTNHPQPGFKPMCKNGSPCHVAAPRGSRTGTQGLKNARERAVIPKELCEHIVKISEG
jgi:site-specific DNA-cytosine methylase